MNRTDEIIALYERHEGIEVDRDDDPRASFDSEALPHDVAAWWIETAQRGEIL